MAPDATWLQYVWREACRQHEIDILVNETAMILAGDGLDLRLWVEDIDLDAGELRTVGAGPGRPLDRAPRQVADARRLRSLRTWLHADDPCSLARDPADDSGLAGTLRPRDLDRPGLATALVGPRGSFGVLVIGWPSGTSSEPRARTLAAQLREPLALALDNDRHLRELQALRRSAEADKQSLLTRLGRERLLDTIVGADGGLREVLARADKVAASDAPVLILGETGAGKEVIARAVHRRSPRADGPFIRVNCGAIPSELVDSELFGHEKGAFTGAVARHRGWFERADGGTLLLDEVGELPPAAQVRLLRVLQDGVVRRVGGETSRPVNVRIVASTHRDLPAMAQTGEFRADLWYRLAVFPLVLPPLRERMEDLPELVAMLTARAARRFGLRPQSATTEDLVLLADYHWPGNVRELASVIDRAAILGDGRRLEIATALGVASAGPQPTTSTGVADPVIASTTGDCGQEILPLDTVMARHICTALAATHGRIEGPGGAAVLLKINPHTLRARMRKLRIEWSRFR